MLLSVYVPAPDTPWADLATVRPGSAIVGNPFVLSWHGEYPTQLVYFEGNIYGAANLGSFKARVAMAAARLVTNYPTVAKMVVPVEALVPVGTYDTDSGNLVLAPGPVDAWIAEG